MSCFVHPSKVLVLDTLLMDVLKLSRARAVIEGIQYGRAQRAWILSELKSMTTAELRSVGRQCLKHGWQEVALLVRAELQERSSRNFRAGTPFKVS